MDINIKEALRYLGVREETDELYEKARRIEKELKKEITPKFTYRVFDIKREGEEYILLPDSVRLYGHSTHEMLKECEKAVLMSCTLGAGFETMLRKEQARDMANAVLMDAMGSAYVEAGCEEAEREIHDRLPEWYMTDRFSPGYGDLPLSVQRDIFSALDITKRLGVVLSDSLLMNPSKSVTAVIGLSNRPQAAKIRGCAYCNLRENCLLRRGGTRCGA